MQDNKQKAVPFTTAMQAGFAGSLLTFGIRWIPECVVNRKIVDSKVMNTGKSFFNVGIAWDLAYRVPANTVVFPAQRYSQDFLLNTLDEHDRTIWINRFAIQVLTGWAVGVIDPIVFYPLDSMRTLAQTNPTVFQGKSVHYFLTHQSALYRGLGFVLVRNSVANIAGWSAKAVVETSLEKTAPAGLQTMLASLVFSFTRIAVAYPFTTIAVLVQADTQQRRGALTLFHQRLKEKGLRSLYEGLLFKGGAQILTLFLQMWLFNWWTHPERKPFNPVSFFSARINSTDANTQAARCSVSK